jgi:hypothetical protein
MTCAFSVSDSHSRPYSAMPIMSSAGPVITLATRFTDRWQPAVLTGAVVLTIAVISEWPGHLEQAG